jgi:hypothetical protein
MAAENEETYLGVQFGSLFISDEKKYGVLLMGKVWLK